MCLTDVVHLTSPLDSFTIMSNSALGKTKSPTFALQVKGLVAVPSMTRCYANGMLLA